MGESEEEEKRVKKREKTYICPKIPNKTLLAVNQKPKRRVIVKLIHV